MPIRRDDVVSDFMYRHGTWLRRGRFGITLYQKWVAERSQADEGFPERLRARAIEALAEDDVEALRCGIVALAVVGRPGDAGCISPLVGHTDPAIARDARTCLFDLRKKS